MQQFKVFLVYIYKWIFISVQNHWQTVWNWSFSGSDSQVIVENVLFIHLKNIDFPGCEAFWSSSTLVRIFISLEADKSLRTVIRCVSINSLAQQIQVFSLEALWLSEAHFFELFLRAHLIWAMQCVPWRRWWDVHWTSWQCSFLTYCPPPTPSVSGWG